jgi:23S rRNA pseudouridine2605 synthase
MLAAVGHPVTRLHRSRYGPLGAGSLAVGDSRELTPEEVAEVRRAAGL